MRAALWYRQRAIDCLQKTVKVFGQPDRAEWLTTIADRWLRIARGVEQRSDAPPTSARLPRDKVYECRLQLSAMEFEVLIRKSHPKSMRHIAHVGVVIFSAR
jgi:hypothetical protein